MIINTKEDWIARYSSIVPALRDIQTNVYGEAVLSEGEMRALEPDEAGDLLETLWVDAPDTLIIHTWPHWDDLCDLCAERWVLGP